VRIEKLFLISIFLLLSNVCAQQPSIGGRVKNFTSSAQDTEGKRSVIKGSEAHALSKEVYEIINPKVTTYQSEDRLDMTIDSPKCVYNTSTRVASSASDLSVKTAEEKFAITGIGWLWQPAESMLTISNQVVATIRKSALVTNQPPITAQQSTNKPTRTNTTVIVHSDFFVHHGDLATFTGHVLVEDGPDTLNCAVLKVQMQEHGGAEQIDAVNDVILRQQETEARAGKAIYGVKENLIRLSEHPSWKSGLREGSSGVLTINRTNNTFHAEQNVYMKLPNTNATSRGTSTIAKAPQANGTNQFIQVYSDSFDYLDPGKEAATGTAFYRGNVRVLQPNGEIQCKFLTVLFSPKDNRLLEAIADDEVEVVSGENRAFGTRAVYDLPTEKITLSGNPHWALDERKGSSDYMIFYPHTEELLALQHVHVMLPPSSTGDFRTFGNAATNRPSATISSTNTPMEIFSDLFSRQGTISVFRDNVLVLDQQGELTCAMLTVRSGASNQVEHITADQKVIIKQENMVAVGDQAVYGMTNGIIQLFGHPKITTPERTVVADSFLINRQTGTFQIRGKYRIEMKNPKKGENEKMRSLSKS
jgi:lipopolysaccharide export system protein LptA